MIHTLWVGSPCDAEAEMGTVHAVFKGGVFTPIGPAQVPDGCVVAFEPRIIAGEGTLSARFSDPLATEEWVAEWMAWTGGMLSRQLSLDDSRDSIYGDVR